MFPMDYEEFCWALGDRATFTLLKQFYEAKISLDAAHRDAMRRLRLYMLVGGMPQAINEYLATNFIIILSLMQQVIRITRLTFYFQEVKKYAQ